MTDRLGLSYAGLNCNQASECRTVRLRPASGHRGWSSGKVMKPLWQWSPSQFELLECNTSRTYSSHFGAHSDDGADLNMERNAMLIDFFDHASHYHEEAEPVWRNSACRVCALLSFSTTKPQSISVQRARHGKSFPWAVSCDEGGRHGLDYTSRRKGMACNIGRLYAWV
jgi:hypothetical protein